MFNNNQQSIVYLGTASAGGAISLSGLVREDAFDAATGAWNVTVIK